MDSIKQQYGKFLRGLGRVLDVSTGFIIDITDKILILLKSIRQILVMILLGMMMLTFFFLVGGILGILLLPTILKIGLFFIIVPFVLELMSKGLKIFRYGTREYLYEKSDSILEDKERKFTSLGSYFKEYIRLEEERIRREEEARRRAYEEQQRRAREQFEEFFRQSSGFGGSFGGSTNGGYGSYSGVTDVGFKERYESACNVLEVDYKANKEAIRKAFRSKAKQYHPDLNKSEGATEMFQTINDANEFLTDDNIQRYKNLS